MPERLQPTQREMLILLNDRVSQLMKMAAEIVTDNKIRNGRLEKLEAGHALAVERNSSRHEALLTRITTVEKGQLTPLELAEIRAEQARDVADGANKRRMKIESPWAMLAAAVILASPVLSVIFHFWH